MSHYDHNLRPSDDISGRTFNKKCCSDNRSTKILPHRRSDEHGFTLIEIVLVIVLIAFASSLVLSRTDAVMVWKQREEIRRFANTWEFLFREALATGQGFRILVDLDTNSYTVRREVSSANADDAELSSQESFTTREERLRRQREDMKAVSSLSDEFAIEDSRQSKPLPELYYDFVLSRNGSEVRLATVLEFPEMAEEKRFSSGIDLIDLKLPDSVVTEGIASIRLSSFGASSIAILHLTIAGEMASVSVNPSTGETLVSSGYQDF